MPLLDHFGPPVSRRQAWDSLHGAWPTIMVMHLNRWLPRPYAAGPNIHLGSAIEIDVGAFDEDELGGSTRGGGGNGGGVATAVWAPARPTLSVASELPKLDEYEVRIYDDRRGRLVAAVELVSPSNLDRPESRRVFVAKCAALLMRGVCVGIVDIVTNREANLYGDLMELLGHPDPSLAEGAPPIYAASLRWTGGREAWRLETWAYPLAVGGSLPTLPLWLADNLAVPLELEASYEESCRVLRIA